MRKIAQWFGPLAWVSVGAVLGLGCYTFWYAQGPSYLSHDPKACVNCHVMRPQYNAWAQGAHGHTASCNDCHVPHVFPANLLVKMENGVRHSIKFTLQNYETPIQIRLANLDRVQSNCIRCHGVQLERMPDHPVKATENTRCTECHMGVGHSVPY